MTHLALLGAGFSRNWGGWLGIEVFEYLLGCPEVIADSELQMKLWRHKDQGGFEAALEELQSEAARTGNRESLERLEGAILGMFADMDKGFRNDRGRIFDFEFTPGSSLVREFLARFDAIFTLNQDLLLERHYFTEGFPQIDRQRWAGYHFPGMWPIPDSDAPFTGERRVPCYMPRGDFLMPPHMQPYFKLHGSSNWREENGHLIMAIGGNKSGVIRANDVLRQSSERFKAMLSTGSASLMIIGYGFQDSHINAMIQEATENFNLKIFIIDPLGVEASQENREAMLRGQNRLAGRIIGASRRTLVDIFGRDAVEREKVMRIFVT